MFDMTYLTSGIAELELTSAESARVVGISCVGCLLQGRRGMQSALAWGSWRWYWRKRKMKEKKRKEKEKEKSRLVNEDVNVERCLDAQKMTGGQLP